MISERFGHKMAIRNIVKFGDPILNKKSRPVEKFDDRLFKIGRAHV